MTKYTQVKTKTENKNLWYDRCEEAFKLNFILALSSFILGWGLPLIIENPLGWLIYIYPMTFFLTMAVTPYLVPEYDTTIEWVEVKKKPRCKVKFKARR